MPDLQHHSPSEDPMLDLQNDEDIATSGLLPRKQELHQKFIQTLQQVLPHLGKDESKIVSALIILALKLEGIIGKDISEKDSKLIEVLKQLVINDDEKKDSAIKIAERLMKTNSNNSDT
ncbi:hypothetical protein DID73_02135 [Candidatus Marinamargulisbacteria bacterium SCGC AG-343-K17]|nr:hypothetical protein DID73_02135 [Candidatus Marinamargulisbacteria bacterium SCGC AG-343-K17]